MQFPAFFKRCQDEPTVSDFESYLAHCILERQSGPGARRECSVEWYCRARDLAFERRDEQAARDLYELSGAAQWTEGEWEGALR